MCLFTMKEHAAINKYSQFQIEDWIDCWHKTNTKNPRAYIHMYVQDTTIDTGLKHITMVLYKDILITN